MKIFDSKLNTNLRFKYLVFIIVLCKFGIILSFPRFLESKEYAGVVDEEDVLTVPVAPNDALRLWCGLVGTPSPSPRIEWSKGNDIISGNSQSLVVEPFTTEHEVYTLLSNVIKINWVVREI